MKRETIDRLTLQIAQLDKERRSATLIVDEDKLTPAEQAFCAVAHARGKRLLRNGWPDFLVLDPESGGLAAIEVKTDEDEISPAQARMFEALEELGLRVMIWSPERPGKLVFWRRHDLERRRRRESKERWAFTKGARQPVTRRVRTR